MTDQSHLIGEGVQSIVEHSSVYSFSAIVQHQSELNLEYQNEKFSIHQGWMMMDVVVVC